MKRSVSIILVCIVLFCLSACGNSDKPNNSPDVSLCGNFSCFCPENVSFKTDFPVSFKVLIDKEGSSFMESIYEVDGFPFICTYPILCSEYNSESNVLSFWILRTFDEALRIETQVDETTSELHIINCGRWSVQYDIENGAKNEDNTIVGSWNTVYYQGGETVVYDSNYNVVNVLDYDGTW